MNRASQIRQKRTLLLLTVSHGTLAKAIEDALLDGDDAIDTWRKGLPVDWQGALLRVWDVLDRVRAQAEEDDRASA